MLKKLRYYTVSTLILLILNVSITLAEESNKDIIFEAQEKLKELGYDPGLTDGSWSKKTEAALRKFQKEHGLKVTGKLNLRTREKLGLQQSSEEISTGNHDNGVIRYNQPTTFKLTKDVPLHLGRERDGYKPYDGGKDILYPVHIKEVKERVTAVIPSGSDFQVTFFTKGNTLTFIPNYITGKQSLIYDGATVGIGGKIIIRPNGSNSVKMDIKGLYVGSGVYGLKGVIGAGEKIELGFRELALVNNIDQLVMIFSYGDNQKEININEDRARLLFGNDIVDHVKQNRDKVTYNYFVYQEGIRETPSLIYTTEEILKRKPSSLEVVLFNKDGELRKQENIQEDTGLLSKPLCYLPVEAALVDYSCLSTTAIKELPKISDSEHR